MPKVLILVAHRPGRSPSQRYRFEQYIPFLEQNGFEFTWSPLLNEEEDEIFYSKGNSFQKSLIVLKGQARRRRDIKQFSKYDIIFIQREASFLGSSRFEEAAFKSGKKVIFDFDDAIWLADTSPGNKKWEWVKDPKKFNRNVCCAHAVVAGNSYLGEKAREFTNADVHIIPTTVDTTNHMARPELRGKEKVCIGWSGSLSTLKHFEEIVPVLSELNKKYPGKLEFKVYGDANYRNEELGIKGVAWHANTEVDMLNSFDIGVMPLPNDEWAKGKCGLKALTYMACGVSVVMSAVGVNSEIAKDGAALLANTKEEWMSALEKLINDKTLREELGKKGRVVVEERYSVEANKKHYLNVFRSLL